MDVSRTAKLTSGSEVLEERRKERKKEKTIDPSAIRKDGTDKGS